MIIVRCEESDKSALRKIKYDHQDILDDGTDYSKARVNKPWGHEVEMYKNESCSIWWLHIHVNQQTSMHCHPNKTTLLAIIGGVATLDTLNGSYELSAGDMVVIEKGAFHRTKSKGLPLVLYEMETPCNKRDLVRLEDNYGRGQGYERT